MAERLVTHAARNSRGVILGVGNPDAEWRQRRREWAISDIVAGRHTYVVAGTRGGVRPIDVVNGPFGAYLRTRADTTEDNNLDNLPLLTLEPWEVALESAEVLAVHAALVPHGTQGQILLFGGNEHDFGNAERGDVFNTRLYDVATNRVLQVGSPEADAFCCGHAFLPDGRLLIAGGTAEWRQAHGAPPFVEVEPEDPDEDPHAEAHAHWSGARECAIYNLDGIWAVAGSLQEAPPPLSGGGGRWYPTLITLGDGRVLAVGGHPLLGDFRHGAWLPELYTPGTDAWDYAPGQWLYVRWSEVDEALTEPPAEQPNTDFRTNQSDDYSYYPRLFVLPGGRVFMASANEGACGWYDPNTGLVDEHAIARPPHGAAFSETNHTAVLLPLLPGDDYAPAVLFFGMGGAHRITLDPEDADPSWQPTAPRDWASNQPPITPGGGCFPRPPRDWAEEPPLRRHGCATILPTGDVLFTGGIDSSGGAGLPDCDGVLEAELYHPGFEWEAGAIDFGQEQWTTTPPAAVLRNYHSVALLLPNGRVLTAGGNLNGQPGGDDVKELRVEIFSPAYSDDPNRPTISQAPGSLTYGQTFQFLTSPASRIRRVALMRCGSVTHAWDGDQRYVGLEFTNPAPGVIEAIAPPDGNVAPPGPYMLWAVDVANRPCRLAPFVLLS